jgi:prepilin-type N-terminal cleavage/methylation domain-containing protein
MKKGFTLIEMLLVVGIIAILAGASLAGLAHIRRSADRQRCQELVANAATALTALFQDKGAWPRAILRNGANGGELDADSALPLALGAYMDLSLAKDRVNGVWKEADHKKLGGYDRFGVLSPWGVACLRAAGSRATLSSAVPTGGKLGDHLLRFAVDLDGDGIINDVSVGGETISIRATAAVWCCGRDGKIEPYSKGLRADDVYSWNVGQTKHVR